MTELHNRALDVSYVNDFIRDVILPELSTVDITYRDGTLMDLMYKIMTPSILTNAQKKHCEDIKKLLWQTVKPKNTTKFHTDTLQFLGKTLQQLESVPPDNSGL